MWRQSVSTVLPSFVTIARLVVERRRLNGSDPDDREPDPGKPDFPDDLPRALKRERASNSTPGLRNKNAPSTQTWDRYSSSARGPILTKLGETVQVARPHIPAEFHDDRYDGCGTAAIRK